MTRVALRAKKMFAYTKGEPFTKQSLGGETFEHGAGNPVNKLFVSCERAKVLTRQQKVKGFNTYKWNFENPLVQSWARELGYRKIGNNHEEPETTPSQAHNKESTILEILKHLEPAIQKIKLVLANYGPEHQEIILNFAILDLHMGKRISRTDLE